MRKVLLMCAAALLIQPVFADMSSRPCIDIAKACVSAGYSRQENGDKRFWFDCMKPVLLGKTVDGVTVDAATVKSCRTDKIKALKQDIKDFESAHSNKNS